MSVLASDNFNRANAANLGANWSIPSGANGIPIVSNQITEGTFPAIEYYSAISWPNDQYVKLVLKTVSTVNDSGVGPAARVSAGGNLYFGQATTSEIRMYSLVSSSYTQLGSDAGAAATSDVIQLDASGTSLTLRKNTSVIVGPVTDSALGSGNAGIWNTDIACTADDWEGGDFSGGTQTFSYSASGGLTFAGSSAELRKRIQAAAGGAVFGGAASLAKLKTIAAAGGLQLAGASVQLRARVAQAAGGLIIAGAAPESSHEAARIVAAAGGLQLSGAASMSTFTSGVVGSDFILRRRRRP